MMLGEAHLCRILRQFINEYYNASRTHLSQEKDCPEPHPVEGVNRGEIVEMPVLGGLHHSYYKHPALIGLGWIPFADSPFGAYFYASHSRLTNFKPPNALAKSSLIRAFCAG